MKYNQLKQIANQSVINPNKAEGSEKILLDVGNSTYWEIRAIELIREAQEDSEKYHDKIKQAITLLLLARVENTNYE